MATTYHEAWLEDFKLMPGDGLLCPVCGGMKFTVKAVDYGIQLACWNEPTYIGIRIGSRPEPER